mmetsp:Transcript_31692/g.105066  ORF Transcript_31692/g.105066 Transcript_31692/m.105066 type:complete len:184 (-) Transcript_31692:119-670(-)
MPSRPRRPCRPMAASPRVMPRSGSWAVAAVAVAATVGGVHGRLTSLHAECQAWQRSAVLPCRKPVQRAAVSLPPGVLLGGATAGTSMFSGYVNVTDQDYLFYLFAEANARAPSDAPLIVWTGGGPGCSAMEAQVHMLPPDLEQESTAQSGGTKFAGADKKKKEASKKPKPKEKGTGKKRCICF